MKNFANKIFRSMASIIKMDVKQWLPAKGQTGKIFGSIGENRQWRTSKNQVSVQRLWGAFNRAEGFRIKESNSRHAV